MGIDELYYFLQGAAAMSCAVAAMFFGHFWRMSRDRFFLFFVAAFVAQGLNWLGLAVVQPSVESKHWFYLLRLVSFLAIIAAIIDKNRRAKPSRQSLAGTTTSSRPDRR